MARLPRLPRKKRARRVRKAPGVGLPRQSASRPPVGTIRNQLIDRGLNPDLYDQAGNLRYPKVVSKKPSAAQIAARIAGAARFAALRAGGTKSTRRKTVLKFTDADKPQSKNTSTRTKKRKRSTRTFVAKVSPLNHPRHHAHNTFL